MNRIIFTICLAVILFAGLCGAIYFGWLSPSPRDWFESGLYALHPKQYSPPPDFASSDSADTVKGPSGFRYSKTAYAAGQADAKRMLAEGRLVCHGFGGFPAPWSHEYEAILLKEYGIESRGGGGCVVDGNEIGYSMGFNEVMEPVIEARYGAKIFEEIARRAAQQFAEKTQ